MSALRAPDTARPEKVEALPDERPRRRRHRPRLRIVPRPAHRPRRWPFRALAAVLIGALLVGIVATQALVNQTSFKMRDLQKQTKAIRQTYAQLRLEVADLSVPERIVREAAALGLRLPDSQDVHVLQVREPHGAGTASAQDRPSSFGLKGLIGEHP